MDHHQRAFALCSHLFLPKSFQLAIQLAYHGKASVLAEKMSTLLSEGAGSEAAKEEEPIVREPVVALNRPPVKPRTLISNDPEHYPVQSFLSQLSDGSQSTQTRSTQSSAAATAGERVNPFRKSIRETSNGENYVNVMNRLGK